MPGSGGVEPYEMLADRWIHYEGLRRDEAIRMGMDQEARERAHQEPLSDKERERLREEARYAKYLQNERSLADLRKMLVDEPNESVGIAATYVEALLQWEGKLAKRGRKQYVPGTKRKDRRKTRRGRLWKDRSEIRLSSTDLQLALGGSICTRPVTVSCSYCDRRIDYGERITFTTQQDAEWYVFSYVMDGPKDVYLCRGCSSDLRSELDGVDLASRVRTYEKDLDPMHLPKSYDEFARLMGWT